MSFAAFAKEFDGSMYSEARKWKNEYGDRCQPLQFMAWQAQKQGFFPEDNELDRLTKNLIEEHRIPEYATVRRKKCRELAAQKWVLDTYFKQYQIDSTSAYADTVEKAFSVVPAELTVFPF